MCLLSLHFTEICESQTTKELASLNSKKAETFGTTATKVLRYPLIFVIKCLTKYGIPEF